MKHKALTLLSYIAILLITSAVVSQENDDVKQRSDISQVKTDVSASQSRVYFAYRSFWPEYETVKRFASVGVHQYCIFLSNTTNSLGEPYGKFPSIWRFPNTYDWQSLYRQFDEYIAVDPQAQFLCMVDLNTPIWLTRSLCHPGDGSFDTFIDLSNCLSNPEWKRHTRKYLTDFLTQTEERYGDRIIAYVLACGQTDEWMDYSAERSSRAKVSAYQSWLQTEGLPKEAWPRFEEFDTASFQNLIHDPQTESNVLNAQRFLQELVAKNILEFAELTKELTGGKKEVGVFFGYIIELTNWRAVGCGHLDYERVLASDAVDFFISPGTYSERHMGGGSGSMGPNASYLLSGKRRLHENDQRTTGYNEKLNEYVSLSIHRWNSEAEDVAGMRREAALALTDHASIWFFDMWGGNFTTQASIDNIGAIKEVWDRWSGRQGDSAAQILLVVDPQSAMRVNGRHEDSPYTYLGVRNALNHCGAPFDACSFNDLERYDLSRIKIAILPGSYYLTQERRELLREKLLRDNRSILWLGASGIDDGQSLDIARVETTTGAPYGHEGLSEKATVGFFGQGQEPWRSYSLSNPKSLNSEILRQIARDSGVNLYVTDQSPVYATQRLLTIHSAKGGVKRVQLPQRVKHVTEAYSGKVVAEDADAFEYDFNEPETPLFELEY
ncbi:MAG: hypothetical protein Q4G03_11670 [Planctomycetia bacterium]|nr:hypothetical protein [Planctomycetia bacterium]